METQKIFKDFAKAFERKIDVDYKITLQYEIIDLEKDNIWQIDVKYGKVNIYNNEIIIPEEIFTLKYDTLLKLYRNELSPITAYANEPDQNENLTSLIEPKVKDEKKIIKTNKQISQESLDFIIRLHKFDEFFNKDYPSKTIIKYDNCRKLHNVNAIGLFSDFKSGILHAFFSIKKGEFLKEPPIEFCVFVLNGKGIIKLDDEVYQIEKNEYYHIKPKANVYISNDDDDEFLDILYLGVCRP
jgi:hypothetical protein